jgi:orotate phosphoribosyltransferase
MDVVSIAQTVFFITGVIVVLLLAVKELYDIADMVGILNLIPKHAERKRQEEEEKLRKILQMQNELLQQYEQRRVERLLEAMGIIDKRYLANLRQAMDFIKVITARFEKDYQQQLRQFCVRFAIDQRRLPENKIILYPNVRFYIDFAEAAVNPIYGEKLAEILQALIANVLKELPKNPNDAVDFNKIAVPKGGNVFLGLQLAERLYKPLVVILDKPRITTDCFWIGELNPGDKLILINDVAVTGDRLGASAEIIRRKGHAQVKHIFVLVERKEWNAREELSKYSEPLYLHSMLQIDDQELEGLLSCDLLWQAILKED